MKSLVIGLGIGSLYVSVLRQLGATVVTVDADPSKSPDYYQTQDAILAMPWFDTVHICTPNYTHKPLAELVAHHAGCVFIEKPGLKTAAEWRTLCKDFSHTRFMMVKNNMWRHQIPEMRECAALSHRVDINWIRKDCVPNPGSWFTTQKLSYGGVSRDLMPHLLSLYIALSDNWQSTFPSKIETAQRWQLSDISTTQYGVVNPNGVYDVDDSCEVVIDNKWFINANWRSMDNERSDIVFHLQNGQTREYDLGWCPEAAYLNMVQTAVSEMKNNHFWRTQLAQDVWIHDVIDMAGAK